MSSTCRSRPAAVMELTSRAPDTKLWGSKHTTYSDNSHMDGIMFSCAMQLHRNDPVDIAVPAEWTPLWGGVTCHVALQFNLLANRFA